MESTLQGVVTTNVSGSGIWRRKRKQLTLRSFAWLSQLLLTLTARSWQAQVIFIAEILVCGTKKLIRTITGKFFYNGVVGKPQ